MREPDTFTNAKDFSDAMTLDLTDEEIKKAFAIVWTLGKKYAPKAFTVENLSAFEDEAKYKLATEVGILATVNPYDNPVSIEFLGRVRSDPSHKFGFDHEKKEWEVKKSVERKEDYHGQKGKNA